MIAEFAQIVGLLSAFTTGRQVQEVRDLASFLEWLTEHDHKELRKAIEQSHVTSIGIKALLNIGIDEIQHKLDEISKQIATLAARSPGLEELASGFAQETLSDQAVEILKHLESTGAEFFLLVQEAGPGSDTLLMSSPPNYVCKEARFLSDDLGSLISLGLLVKDHNSKGKPLYRITRSGSKLAKNALPSSF